MPRPYFIDNLLIGVSAHSMRRRKGAKQKNKMRRKKTNRATYIELQRVEFVIFIHSESEITTLHSHKTLNHIHCVHFFLSLSVLYFAVIGWLDGWLVGWRRQRSHVVLPSLQLQA